LRSASVMARKDDSKPRAEKSAKHFPANP